MESKVFSASRPSTSIPRSNKKESRSNTSSGSRIQSAKFENNTRRHSEVLSRNASTRNSASNSRLSETGLITSRKHSQSIIEEDTVQHKFGAQSTLSIQGHQTNLNSATNSNYQNDYEDESELFKKTLFGKRSQYSGPPENFKTKYDADYYNLAIEPRLQDRTYRFFVNRQKSSPDASLFRPDLLPMVKNFLKEDCDENERKEKEAFIQKLTSDLDKYKNGSLYVVANITNDTAFFQAQQYAGTFVDQKLIPPLREWLKDEANKNDIPLFKNLFSRFNNYFMYARGTTTIETDYRVSLAVPRDINLSKPLEGAVQEKIWNKKHPKIDQKNKKSFSGKLGTFKTIYSQHYPPKNSDSFRKFLENKQKRLEEQKFKLPYGTLNVLPSRTTNQIDFPENRNVHPLLKTDRATHTQEVTASIACRTIPNTIDTLPENEYNSNESIKNSFTLKQEAIPYPKATTTNKNFFLDTTDTLKSRMNESGDKMLFDLMKRNKPKPFDESFSGKIPTFIWKSEYNNSFQSHGSRKLRFSRS